VSEIPVIAWVVIGIVCAVLILVALCYLAVIAIAASFFRTVAREVDDALPLRHANRRRRDRTTYKEHQ